VATGESRINRPLCCATTLSEEIGKNTISDVAWEAREVLRAHR
jgi:hypothetical protein